METQLQELIDKIKKEGIENAEQEAEKILAEARRKADAIVAEAEEKAKSLRDKAKKEIQQQEHAGRQALTQAGRDVIISLKKKITDIFDDILRRKTEEAMKGRALEEIISVIVKEWVKKGSADIAVLLGPEDLKAIETDLIKGLQDEIRQGVEIKVSDHLQKGFFISEKDGSAYYNFSADGIAEIISEYVNPKLAEIMKQAAEGE
jgi:V/A-type H+/Na+-transporting ATPase subunit E